MNSVNSLSVQDILDPKTMIIGLHAQTKGDVIESLTQRLHDQGYVDSIDAFTRAVWQREREGATGIGGHVAIPHGRSDTVRRNGVAIAVLDHEIAWESLDETGAKVVVLMAVGASDAGSEDHLKMLSLFARKLGKAHVIETLLNATGTQDVISAFAD